MIVAIVAALVLGAIVIFNLVSNGTQEQQGVASSPSPEPEPEPVCRAHGEFVAGFMSPQVDDGATHDLLERMNTDAVTFGGRIVPATEDDYPDEVVEAVGDQDIYEYTVTMNWQGLDLESS